MDDATDTRDEAYRALIEDEVHLGAKQSRVFDVIAALGPISNARISAILGVPINRITGRVFELRDMGLVEDAGTELGPYGKHVHVWKKKV